VSNGSWNSPKTRWKNVSRLVVCLEKLRDVQRNNIPTFAYYASINELSKIQPLMTHWPTKLRCLCTRILQVCRSTPTCQGEQRSKPDGHYTGSLWNLDCCPHFLPQPKTDLVNE
jgi:hypothetical protein